MYPKAYLFHNSELEGLDHLISSPVTLTFNARQINANQKAHKDIFAMLALFNVISKPIYPKFITSIYAFKQREILATILKFGITEYCYLKSEEHFALVKSLVNVSKKLEPTMQNISGLESNMRSCYKSLEVLKLEQLSPMEIQFIESLSEALSVRKVAKLKLHDLIRTEFIADIC